MLLEGVEAFKTAGDVTQLVINLKKPNLLYLLGATVLEVKIK